MNPTCRPGRARRALVPIVLAATLLAACGSTPSPGSPSQVSPLASAEASSPKPSSAATPSSMPAPTSPPPPSVGASPGPSEPAPPPSESIPSPTPTPFPNPDPAASCTGSDRNRDFYAAVAEAVAWDVYCPVLPSGWYVDQGTYRLANGGRLEIAYTGPAGARLELQEGAFCSEADGCVPAGAEKGEASFGDRTGSLVELAGGGWAIVVDRGERISWLAVGEGLSEAEFVDLVGRFARVDA